MPVRVKYTKGDQTVVIEFSKNAEPFDVMETCRKHFFPNEVEEAYNREDEIRKREEQRKREERPTRARRK
jgi:hypothetical protein